MSENEKEVTTFPNPLQVGFGGGRILMSTFHDAETKGIVFRDTGESHEVGSDANELPIEDWEPRSGEIYFAFTNKESLKALKSVVDDLLEDWENDAKSK